MEPRGDTLRPHQSIKTWRRYLMDNLIRSADTESFLLRFMAELGVFTSQSATTTSGWKALKSLRRSYIAYKKERHQPLEH